MSIDELKGYKCWVCGQVTDQPIECTKCFLEMADNDWLENKDYYYDLRGKP